MLQKLNERLQGIVAWVIISIIAMTFTLFGIEYYIQSHQATDHVILEINGVPVTKEMVDVRLERARRMQQDGLEFNPKDARQNVLDDLVSSQIALQTASKNGFYVGDAEAQQAIFSLPQFSENGHFSINRYQQALASAMYTHEQFQHDLKQEMLLQQQRFMFLATEFTLPNEFSAYIKKKYQARRYQYVAIPVALFSKNQKISVTEQQEYYAQHAQEFMSPETIRLAYIRLSISDIKSTLKVKPEELDQFYRENSANFSEKGKIKPFSQVKDEIEKQLLNDKVQVEYARLVEILSDVSYQSSDELDTAAKALGLKIEQTDFFTRSGGSSELTQNPQVLNLAFSDALLISGENSQPFQLNPESIVVFRVLERKPAQVLPFETVKDEVYTRLIQQKSVQETAHYGEKLLNAQETDRAQLMKMYQLAWHESALETQNHTDAFSSIRDLAFSVKKVSDMVGKLVTLDDGSQAYVVLRLEAIVDGTSNHLSKQKKQALLQKLSFEKGILSYDVYLADAKKKYLIKTK